MKAVVFHGINDLRVDEVPKPQPKPGEAVIRITATTICGTDVHIVKGEYPVRPGLILGHEPVGIIEELGEGLGAEYALPAAQTCSALVASKVTFPESARLVILAGRSIGPA